MRYSHLEWALVTKGIIRFEMVLGHVQIIRRTILLHMEKNIK